MGFPGGSVVKSLPAKAEDVGSIPGSRRFPEEETGNPLQYSCLKIPMDRGAWQATIHGAAKSRRQHAQRVAGIWGVAVTLPTLGGRYPWTSKSFSLKLVGELWTALMSVLRSLLLLLLLLLLSHFSPVWPHRQQSMRLPHPWDSPGKNTGVGCHFLLHLRSLCSHY